MQICELIKKLSVIQKKYGEQIEVTGYDCSVNNKGLLDSDILKVQVLYSDEKGADYVEIGFLPRGVELWAEP